jgi:dUTP pyrophosphatase
MNRFKLDFKKLRDGAITPTYGSEYAAGADLYACIDETLTINPGQTQFIPTGLAMSIPEGLVGLIYARSGMACKHGLAPANKVGVIDSDYRGEIIVALHNHSDQPFDVETNTRVAQMVFAPYYCAEFSQVDQLDDTVRGDGGFGSTGRK